MPRRTAAELEAMLAECQSALAEREQELADARGMLGAAQRVLGAIASAGGDLQAVLDTIVACAAQLGGTDRALIALAEDGDFRRAAGTTVGGERWTLEDSGVASSIALGRRHSVGHRAILDREVVHVPDLAAVPVEELAQQTSREAGLRTLLAVPLVRGDAGIGVLFLSHVRPSAFTEEQVALVKGFADQAAVAIENARVFSDLNDANASLTEALEQQTATAKVLATISRSPTDLQGVLDTIIASAARLCDAPNARLFRLEGDELRAVAADGVVSARLNERQPTVPATRDRVVGRAVIERRTVHVPNRETWLAEFPESLAAGARALAGVGGGAGATAALAVPLLREGTPLGAVMMQRNGGPAFSASQIRLVETFADQAAIAIENARLFAELQDRLEEQTATAEVLRVISQSPTDVLSVFNAICRGAGELCGAAGALIQRTDGRAKWGAGAWVREGSGLDLPGGLARAMRVDRPTDARTLDGPGSVTNEVMRTKRTIHIADMWGPAGDAYAEDTQAFARRAGVRTHLAIPLLRGDQVLGALCLYVAEVRPFTERQIALLETFADQAVIAIENARLFREVQESNAGLREALDQQTVTAEVLSVISRSPTELQTVLDTIADSAQRLCASDWAIVGLVGGDGFRSVAGVTGAGRRLTITEPSPLYPLSRDFSVGSRAIVDRATVHVEDLAAISVEDLPAPYGRADGVRTNLSVPLLRGDEAIGVISLSRRVVRPFTEPQIALVRTFADQAVIAIENSRLFQELEERLAEQTATAEVLAAISRAPTDLQGVLDTITDSATRLCGGSGATLVWGPPDDRRALAYSGSAHRRPVGQRLSIPGGPADFQYQTGEVFHSADVPNDERLSEEYRRYAIEIGQAAVLSAPLIAAGEVRGTLAVRRDEPRAFSDRQIAVLQTFAAQAVIAVENARLFSELNNSNAGLKEALEQQTATAQVLDVISRSPTDLQTVLDTIADSAGRLCQSDHSVIALVDGDTARVVAGVSPTGARPTIAHPAPPIPLDRNRIDWTRAIVDQVVVHTDDLAAVPVDELATAAETARRLRIRTQLAVPLIGRGRALGAIILPRAEVRAFTEREISLVETFADQAVIAIENARLFSELQERLEEQTATSEVLRVISESPTDIQPVLETIVENAMRLCEAEDVLVHTVDGDHLVNAAVRGPIGLGSGTESRRPMRHDWLSARAVMEMRTIQLDDVAGPEGDEFPLTREHAGRRGFRTVLVTPMIVAGRAVGDISLRRRAVRRFTERQVRLLEGFASQAAIALENTRLFRELRERTADLSASVGRLTALFEVSGAVSATLDLDQVLQTVVQRAAGLAGAEAGTIYVFDPDRAVFEPRANHGLDVELTEVLRAARLGLGEGPVGQAAVGRAPVQVPDLAANGPDGPARRVLEAGFRSLLAVPLLREQAIVGALVVRRRTPGEFAASTVELLQTFAAQSALAIQNARLFQELAEKSRQLEEASRHKSEFLANMSHELRTPLNAIIGFSEVLLERYFGEINAKQEDYLKDVLSSGQHLLALINDILDLSKVEAGRMELEVGSFELGEALAAGLVMVKERASKKGIELTLDVTEDVGRVEADERKVKQVVFNLLTNAVKFTPDGGTVTVSARRSDESVEVAVVDTGVGIAAEDLGKVFEEFGQARNQQGQTEGTGLGLALVQRYVELHGGAVRVESEVGRGSRFAFVLPVAPPTRA